MTHRRAADIWGLRFPMPLDEQDRDNLSASGARRVIIEFWQQQNHMGNLVELGQRGVSVILNVEEPDPPRAHIDPRSYYHPDGARAILEALNIYRDFANIEAVVVGREPEHEYDLTWASDPAEGGWGNTPWGVWKDDWAGKASAHADAFERVVEVLRRSGVKVVSPGWTHRRITPHDPAQPGRMTWARLCAVAYNKGAAGAIHLYGHGAQTLYKDGEDYNRLVWALGNERERVHTEPWIIEADTSPEQGGDVDHMNWCIGMYEAITNPAHANGQGLGAFIPFTSNGVPGENWPPRFLIRDPAAYQVLGAYLATH